MSEPFLGEIRLVSFSFPPRFWALCNGQLLPINQNQALFSLLGTQYGGNGQTNFALPNMQGRTPLHFGAGPGLTDRVQGELLGSEAVTLTTAQLPAHAHPRGVCDSPATLTTPASTIPARAAAPIYRSGAVNLVGTGVTSGPGGNSQAHANMMPFLTISFIIALSGIFPSRN
jgi:microcystin-dependent protein